jgi:hypothetical protein
VNQANVYNQGVKANDGQDQIDKLRRVVDLFTHPKQPQQPDIDD